MEAQRRERPSIFYIDLLRSLAAFAVVNIHVLGPFRQLYGEVSGSDWLAAAAYNSIYRWAVPVFMMISGALLLSSTRDFHCKEYLRKRVSKVLVPFVIWTILYALLTAWTNGDWGLLKQILIDAKSEPTWYHLWFFYDFIPLYFVIPFLALLLKRLSAEHVKLLLVVFFFLFLMKWLKMESFLLENLILYTGYLVLGWFLFNRDNSKDLPYWLIAGVIMLILNIFGTWYLTRTNGKYSSVFMGYKTLNTAVIGGMIFVLAQTYGNRIPGRARAFISLLSRYSLGVYLVHPLILLPVRNLDNSFYSFWGSNWLAIPVLSIGTIVVSLIITVILAGIPVVKRIVP